MGLEGYQVVRALAVETWRWVNGRLFDVYQRADGSITFKQVADKRPRKEQS